jgi:hypothetical protein
MAMHVSQNKQWLYECLFRAFERQNETQLVYSIRQRDIYTVRIPGQAQGYKAEEGEERHRWEPCSRRHGTPSFLHLSSLPLPTDRQER